MGGQEAGNQTHIRRGQTLEREMPCKMMSKPWLQTIVAEKDPGVRVDQDHNSGSFNR